MAGNAASTSRRSCGDRSINTLVASLSMRASVWSYASNVKYIKRDEPTYVRLTSPLETYTQPLICHCTRDASMRRVADRGEVGRRRLDRELARQREEVAVAGNQDGSLVGRERDQVVVPGIDAAYRRRSVGVSRDQGRTRQPCHERLGVARRYQAPQFRIRQSATELGKKCGRDD